MKGEITMLSKMNHSIKDLTGDQTAIIPMTDEELAAVGGGSPGLLVSLAVILGQNYVAGENGWLTQLGNKIGDDWYEMLK